jgi:putative exosortase-associated protein (TIGR04073 family)
MLRISAALALCAPVMQTQGGAVNDAIVKAELYAWNRFADFLETVRCGVAVGPCVGAEVAFTDRYMLGAVAAVEAGASFPHFVPPLWLVPYAEESRIFSAHEGVYMTLAYGPVRKENTTEISRHFDRDPLDLRVELGLAMAHAYVAVKTAEIIDFGAGFVGYDPADDDAKLDPTVRRAPADQLGRGAGNILFGWMEIYKNMVRIGRDEGDIAGATKGVGLGLWRTSVRGVVGVFELVTFPFGWSPVIEPEYVFQSSYITDWRLNHPEFTNQY